MAIAVDLFLIPIALYAIYCLMRFFLSSPEYKRYKKQHPNKVLF